MKRKYDILKARLLFIFLFVSYFLFAQKKIDKDSIKVKNLEEVIVTGVFDKRTRMDAPIAISILNSKMIESQVPNSAADLLKNVPGVYVNSSLGEIRNNVASRGISAGSADGTFAYEYISMQEDGLPITNTTSWNYGPDFFLRADANISQIDAVRGGPASITAANAPGGIFNYISKTGKNEFAGEVRAKYGIQGRNNNSYYRADANFGGPLGNNWFYNIGGFYRYDLGARYPGYPLNEGGQIKGNLVKKYNRGSLKIFLKYLNDKNGLAQLIPTRGYTDPKPAEGFTNSSSNLLPALSYNSLNYLDGSNIGYNSKNLNKSKFKSIQANWDHDLGDNWKLTIASKLTENNVLQNNTMYALISSITDPNFYYLIGALGVGNYSFKDAITGNEIANVNAALGTNGLPTYQVNSNSQPNQSIQSNSIFLSPLNVFKNKVNESMNQVIFNKKLKEMNLSFGGYYGYSKVDRLSGINGMALTTMQDRPRLLTLELTGVTVNDPTKLGNYQATTNEGIAQGVAGINDIYRYQAKQNQLSLFFGHTWDITQKLTFDWGVRYENVSVKGNNIRSYTQSDPNGGTDKNYFTLYDNNISPKITNGYYSRTFNNFSYSAAFNYKFDENLAIYGRYSKGSKNPDLDIYFAASTPELIALLDPKQRKTEQFEMGIKSKSKYVDAFITPFYSILSNVPVGGSGTDTDGSLYNVPNLYNKNGTLGVEFETNLRPVQHFSLRAVVTLQNPKVKDGFYWDMGNPGKSDDKAVSFSGTTVAFTPKVIANITPTLTFSKFIGFVTWSYMGMRQGNYINTYQLPAFSQFDLGCGYNFTEKLNVMININNLFNVYGIMSYQRPGNINEQVQGFENFTAEQVAAAKANNTPYFTIANPPTSGYITLTYKL